MRVLCIISLLFLFASQTRAQVVKQELIKVEANIEKSLQELYQLREKAERIKLQMLMTDLESVGLPEGEPVRHAGMILSFNNETRQANWVSHIISPEIRDGRVGRTNDFRDDPLVDNDAIEADYFLKTLQKDSSYVYDGFGYDRGHLAPSADFAWSRIALSESYFYSNMSPQNPDFNREDWAEMEGILRGYVWRNDVPLYIVTLPFIEEDAKVVERGKNKLPVPSRYIKVALDIKHKRGVAFVMPNRKSDADIAEFAVSIDRAEEISGLDFFSDFDNDNITVESEFDISVWFPESTREGVEPIYAPSLSQGHINTSQAKRWMGSQKKVNVCGTVVSTRFSGSGNYWINVDKKFPNTVFSVYIRKKDFIHFDSVHKDYLMNEKVCFNSKVTEMFSLPAMNIVRQEQVKEFVPTKK